MHKSLPTSLALFAACFGLNQAPDAIAENTNDPWLLTALKLQREIDLNTPLREASFLGTHNSYNSKSYQTATRYLDPNQTLTIYNQLEAGVRSIELDAHWTLTSTFSHDILLCHGLPNHVGCGLFDRPFKEGLIELHDWLKAHPGELVLLYIERHLDGHEAELVSQLKETLEDFIFKASVMRHNDNTHACVALPTKLSKAEILRAGKQLVIVTKECETTDATYNDYVFAGIGDIPSLPFTFIDEKIERFTPYPDCSKSNVFSPDPYHSSLWRIYEDRTMIGGFLKTQKPILDEDMQELVRCGINWQALDMLTNFDSRLLASIWSWAPSYPREQAGDCAFYKFNKGIENSPCEKNLAAFACYEENTHAIKAVPAFGNWSAGQSSCQILAGKNWHFAVPVNAQQMDSLKDSMQKLAIQEIWLNYKADDKGHWQANG